jgi:hypothetical protein
MKPATTAARTWTVTRQVGFFQPADNKGKWHAANRVSRTAVCGSPAELTHVAIRTAVGDQSSRVHPLVCRSCLRMTTRAGATATGVEQ